ncbi:MULTISPECIES: hypothetical protein [unclassified Mycobacterium]|uniref:hypothetical protein n=1 Tax=unclassified Mycobacterium TaxID=2642494 RepID=UPI0029C7355E|nr:MULTISPECIES: hypothetical protein [unclassified Mycobacterium]
MNIFIDEDRRVVRRRSQTPPHGMTRILIGEVGDVDYCPSGLEPGRANDQASPLLQLRRHFGRRAADISMLTASGQLYA